MDQHELAAERSRRIQLEGQVAQLQQLLELMQQATLITPQHTPPPPPPDEDYDTGTDDSNRQQQQQQYQQYQQYQPAVAFNGENDSRIDSDQAQYQSDSHDNQQLHNQDDTINTTTSASHCNDAMTPTPSFLESNRSLDQVSQSRCRMSARPNTVECDRRAVE
jgi:hypothetical protein